MHIMFAGGNCVAEARPAVRLTPNGGAPPAAQDTLSEPALTP